MSFERRQKKDRRLTRPNRLLTITRDSVEISRKCHQTMTIIWALERVHLLRAKAASTNSGASHSLRHRSRSSRSNSIRSLWIVGKLHLSFMIVVLISHLKQQTVCWTKTQNARTKRPWKVHSSVARLHRNFIAFIMHETQLILRGAAVISFSNIGRRWTNNIDFACQKIFCANFLIFSFVAFLFEWKRSLSTFCRLMKLERKELFFYCCAIQRL